MRRAYEVNLLDEQGYFMGNNATITEQEPTDWVYEQMELNKSIAVARISDVVIKDNDFVVVTISSKVILRQDFDAAVASGAIRFNYNEPSDALGVPVKQKFEAAAIHKKLDNFILSLTDVERSTLRDKLIGGE